MKPWGRWGYVAMPLASLALSACGTTMTAAAQRHAPLTVAIMPTAAIISPTKPSGAPWDVGSAVSPLQVSPRQRRALTAALIGTDPVTAIAAELGARALDSFAQNAAMPDVHVNVLVNGRPVGRTRTFANSPTPSWTESIEPVTAGPADVIQFVFVDADILFDDPIGTCETSGQPPIDARGFVAHDALTCSGAVLAFAVRFRDPAGAMFRPTTSGAGPRRY